MKTYQSKCCGASCQSFSVYDANSKDYLGIDRFCDKCMTKCETDLVELQCKLIDND